MSASEAPLMLGVSGLRGIVGASLTPDLATRYAGAFGGWLRDFCDDTTCVAIGRDGRAGGASLHAAAIAGLLGAGHDVVDLGVVTTPTVGACVDEMGARAGMVVTASHNPQEWNGLKCLLCEGDLDSSRVSAPRAELAARIIERFKSDTPNWTDWSEAGTLETRDDGSEQHVQLVLRSIVEAGCATMFDNRMHVVLDSVNSSGARLCQAFYSLMPDARHAAQRLGKWAFSPYS